MANLCRFEPGELAPYVESCRPLPLDAVILEAAVGRLQRWARVGMVMAAGCDATVLCGTAYLLAVRAADTANK